MKIVILGRTQFLYNAILWFINEGYSVSSVITAPAAPEYTKRENDFKKLASKIKAKFFITKSIGFQKIISAIKGADVGVSVNWPFVIERKYINYFRIGILNAHFGDLPNYRGNACPNWAIINGEEEVVLSIHLMEGGLLDCGRVITQGNYPITANTYIGDIYKWAEDEIPKLFCSALKLLRKNPDYTLKYADPNSLDGLRCYPRRPEDSRIDWSRQAIEINRLIRASSKPFSGAYSYINGRNKIVVWKAELIDENEPYLAVPGQVSFVADGYFVVITGGGKLKITEWESRARVNSVRQRLE